MNARRDEIVLAGAFFWILALLVVPLPPTVLDFMLSLSMSVSLLILLVALGVRRAGSGLGARLWKGAVVYALALNGLAFLLRLLEEIR